MSLQSKNIQLAEQLDRLADLTDIDGGSFWSVRAYRSASDVIRNLDIPISDVNDFMSLPGVGKGLSKKIKEFLNMGYISDLLSLESHYPIEALSMTVVPGIGAKTAYKYYKQGICNFDQLVKASEDGKIKNENIMRGIKLALRSRGRLPLNEAMSTVYPILLAIRNSGFAERVEFAGSVRRGKETIKDVDILVVSNQRAEVIKIFQQFGEELINGEDKSRIIAPIDAHTSVQVDLLFAPKEEFGSALAYFTGSKEHNVALRTLAIQKNMKINEHGFWSSSGSRLGGEYEEELYHLLGIPYCPPELREGNEILEEVPALITRKDITSDWHMHTSWSADAQDTFEAMAMAAKSRGLKKIGVTDHTEKNYSWDPNKISDRRNEAIHASQVVGIPIFAACETGINLDGTLDWPDQYLSQMDYVIASIHRSHNKNVTERLIAAAKHPMVKVIGHPTGRILGKREIPEADWNKVFKVCAEENVLLEINGARIDLSADLIRQAKEQGCKFVINSDAHATHQLEWQDYGIITARRAGLTKNDINTPEF